LSIFIQVFIENTQKQTEMEHIDILFSSIIHGRDKEQNLLFIPVWTFFL